MLHSFSAAVVTGLAAGRTMGFPTLNLVIPADFPLTPGVYAARTFITGEWRSAALFFGERMTLGVPTPTLEVHVIAHTVTEQLGKLDVEVLAKIREPQKFGSVEELKTAIQADCEKIRNMRE